MKVRRFKRAVPLAAVAALAVSGLVVTFAPSSVEAATFTTIPTRLYMAPAGVSIPNDIAEFVGVQVGTLKFDGSTDPISQDLRSIVVNTVTGTLGCDLTASPYDIDDCSRVQIGPISHGRLKMGNITTIPNGAGPGLDVYMLPGAVRIDSPYQVANGSYYLAINGEPTDLNNALKTLVYTPDAGYYYEGSNAENVNVLVQPGNADPSASATIQIRVLNVNGFPTVAAPSDKSAQAGVELKIPAVDPGLAPPFTGRAVTITDADNDEDVDGGQANPPTPEGTWQDGAGNKMLLVGYLACGTPTVEGTSGFHFRGGTFEVNNNDIRSIVRDFFQFTQLPASGQAIITTLLDGIDAVQPGLTTTMLATNSPTTYTSLFAGIGTMYEVQYAVSQISFLQPAAADNCTMWTIVSDLGNNGLPLQYVGDPPTGIEVPMIGLGLDSFDINTGDLDEINVSFADPSTLVVNEATAPTPVVGNLVISPAVHPEFTIQWEVNPHSGDPDVAGIATAGSDFAGTYNNTLTIPENEEFIPILNQVLPDPPNTTVYPDNVDEGNETFMFKLLLNQPAPAGYFVTSSAPTKTVLIVDDDDAPREVSVDNPSVVEGDSGTSNLRFTLTLDGPADGTESVTVSTADGTATVADNDYDAIAGQLVQFALGETTKTVDVTVHGDLTDELGAVNETLTLNLSGASNVTINTPSGIGAIVNDDQPRTVSIADKSMVEGNAGTSLMTFVLSLDSPAKGNESVTVDTSNGTAMVADSDYVALTGAPVVFVAGATTATVSVTINGDTTPESNETFNVTLGSNLNVLINDGTAIGTILNDDGVPDVSINDVTVTEGDSGTTAATFTVTLSSAAVVAASVSVATSDGTATIANNDYAAVGPTTLNFAIGDVTKTVTVDVNGDTDVEVDETFNVTLSNPDQLVIGDATGLGTITNDDAPPVLSSVISIADATVTEGPAADETTISMTNSAGRNCVVLVTTVDGTAVAGTPGDYTAIADAPVGLASVASATQSFTITDDVDVEGGETFTVNLTLDPSSDPPCVLGDSSATILIVDNDSPVDVTAPTVTINQGIAQADPTSVSPIVFTATFSEPVVGFGDVAGDVVLSGTSNGTKAATVTGGPTIFTVSVAVTGATNSGTVIATIPAAAASDGTNASLASTSTDNTVLLDKVAPTATIDQAAGQTDPTTTSPILFTVVFSEPVTGFVTGDVTLSGTAGATSAVVTGSSTTYTVTVAGMTVAGTVIVAVAAGVAVDASNNGNVAATVVDNTVQYDLAPNPGTLTITVPANITQNNDPGQAGAIVLYPAVTTTGGVAPVVVVCTAASGSFYPIGTTTVSCTATDADGPIQDTAVVTSSFTVKVLDVEAPVIADPADIVRVVQGFGTVVVSFPTPAATDNSGVPPTVACSPSSGTSFSVGVSTVTCTATDGAGNQASVSFTVTVVSDGNGLGLPATGSSPQPLLALALLLIGVGLLLFGQRRSRTVNP